MIGSGLRVQEPYREPLRFIPAADFFASASDTTGGQFRSGASGLE